MALHDLHRDAPATDFASIELRPVAIDIGAEIGGVDLSKPLPPEQIADIRAALLQWKVIFFRDQPMDHEQHIAFARQFGAPTPGHAVFGHDDKHPEIYSIAKHRATNRGQENMIVRPWSGWHADVTAAVNPPFASILRGDIVPPYGGDTLWTNLVAAYNALSPAMRGFVETLRGVHAFRPPPGVEKTEEYEERVRQNTLITEHPLVSVHPETGQRVLYVSPSYVKSIAGLKPRESEALLELLWEHAVRPEFTVRFKWEPGSVAFWDNRSVVHLAPRDIFDSDFDRQFYRVTLLGDVPVGVDGEPSTAVEGKPIEAV